MIIFDCNGVLVDGEVIAASVAAEEFTRAGVPMSPRLVGHFFTGRRAADMIAAVETAAERKLPADFGATLTAATLRRFRAELRTTPHADYALSWLRGPKCIASSAPRDRIHAILEMTELLRFFQPNVFSSSDVPQGKPAPDLFLHAAAKMNVQPKDCIVIEDSPVGVQAAVAAGMRAIGFVGGSHAGPQLAGSLQTAGAKAVIADLRVLKSTVVALRGW
jgi:HAD superfamily hydrolase (TIGR01509 family)